MIRVILIFACMTLSWSAVADKVCEANAQRTLDRFFRTVEVDPEIVQTNYLREVELKELRSTTPGQQNQEFVGDFDLHYRGGDYALFRTQSLRVVFRSSVGCDQLKVFTMDVVKNVLSEYGDAARRGTKNSFSCEAR